MPFAGLKLSGDGLLLHEGRFDISNLQPGETRKVLFTFDVERNAGGAVLGMTFYGRGWGHGVGMCQVGAYGMALEGATFEEILTKYYKGIELRKVY